MGNTWIVFGSSTGATEGIARKIAESFESATVLDAARFDMEALGKIETGDLLLLGSSTWGFGDLQDDWHVTLPIIENADLSGITVGVFGTGDQESYSDTFVDSIGILADAAEKAGADLVGFVSANGYAFEESRAVRDGKLAGLAIDQENQADLTSDRVSAWVEQVKSER